MDGERGAHYDAKIGLRGEIAVVEEGGRELFAEEDDFGFDEAVAVAVDAVGDRLGVDGIVHALFGVGFLTVDAALSGKNVSLQDAMIKYYSALRCETAVRLYYLIAGYSGLALKAVNVLGEQLQQKPFLV